jgi:hypothetical protein
MELEIQEHVPNVSIGHPRVPVQRPDQRVYGGQPEGGRPDTLVQMISCSVVYHTDVVLPFWDGKVLYHGLDLGAQRS